MYLAIFDIDGTLTDTNAMDNRCFEQALADEFNFIDTAEHWHACPHISDSGLTHFIFQQKLGRAPQPAEVGRLRERFLELMNEAVITDPLNAIAITGAATTLTRLQEEPNWAVAIATGCWQASAQFKLSRASIPFAHLPLAHSDQLLAREDILSDALAQAEAHYQTSFERVVYIGDGLWDVRATRNLQMPFVGIAQHDDRAAKLKAEGANDILRDFSDYQLCLDALLTAQVPKYKTSRWAHQTSESIASEDRPTARGGGWFFAGGRR